MTRENRSAVCPSHHSFDYAKSGYLNLLLKQSTSHGDNAEMVKARTVFLSSGAYAFLRERLKQLSSEINPAVLCDLGCGEGYYTQALCAEEKYGFDLSKDALKHAAKHDHNTAYTVSSIFHLPLADESADLCITCFAPVAGEEISRILKKGGRFILVLPARKHLYELKELLYQTPYENDEEETKVPFKMIHEEHIEEQFTAEGEVLNALFMMTPYAYHTAERGKQKLAEAKKLEITASFVIRIYEKQ